jgi:uncharacterized protein with HEPN domain
MRPGKLYLADIVEAADAITQYLAGLTKEKFLSDEIIRSAIVFKLIIIGEAAGQLSEALRQRYRYIPWSDVIGLRHIAVHAYHKLDWDILWDAATREAPALRAKIAAILEAEYPEPKDQ